MARSHSTEESIVPTRIERLAEQALAIVWSNGVRMRYSAAKLRTACPCATCREKRRAAEQTTDGPSFDSATSGAERARTGSVTTNPSPAFTGARRSSLPVLSPRDTVPLAVQRMTPVGNYAYNIAFSDGHDAGIFPFEFLYQIGDQEEPAGETVNRSMPPSTSESTGTQQGANGDE